MRFSVIVEEVWGAVTELVVAYPEGGLSGGAYRVSSGRDMMGD